MKVNHDKQILSEANAIQLTHFFLITKSPNALIEPGPKKEGAYNVSLITNKEK